MREFRRFDNMNNILEINQVTKSYIKSTRFFLNNRGCYVKMSSYKCPMNTYMAYRKRCIPKVMKALRWNQTVPLGLNNGIIY